MRLRSIIVTGIIPTILLIGGCNKESKSEAISTPAVDVATVRVEQVTPWDRFNGRVASIETVAIRPRVGGYITTVAYKEGSEVKKGDLLFIIDQRPYRAALDSARARLERARASLVFAKQQNQRAQRLVKTGAVSKEKVEQTQSDYDQSLAELHAAESAVAIAALDVEFTEIRSPINGRTSRAQLTVGNLAIADQSILTSVVSQDPVYVYFDPDEKSFLQYQKKRKTSRDTSVRIGLSTDEDFPYEGELTFIDNQVNATTGTIRARATVRNPDRFLVPGLYAKVQLSVGQPTQALLVPARAILTDQDKRYVYILDAENKAQRRYIEIGDHIDKNRVVTSGLARNDKVVVSGLQQIYASGTPVLPHILLSENNVPTISSAIQDGQ